LKKLEFIDDADFYKKVIEEKLYCLTYVKKHLDTHIPESEP
jgi:hypothetical protein